MSSTCRSCSLKFADNANLQRHLKASPDCKIKKESSSTACRNCSLKFADNANLQRHLKASPDCKIKKESSQSKGSVKPSPTSEVVVPKNVSGGGPDCKTKKVSSQSKGSVKPSPTSEVVVPKSVSGGGPSCSNNSTIGVGTVFSSLGISSSELKALSNAVTTPLRAGVRESSLEYKVVVDTPVQTFKQKRLPFQVMLLIDDSGSMAGAMYREAIAGCRGVLNELKDKDDWAGVATFSEKSSTTSLRNFKDFVHLKTKKAELESHLSMLESNGACGGGTALYDAVVEVTGKFKSYSHIPDLQHLLVVATDGENNRGNLSAINVNEALHRIRLEKNLNLHVTILPIGLSDSLHEELKKLLAGKPTLSGGRQCPKLGEIQACNSASVVREQFTNAFQTVVHSVQTTLSVTRTSDGGISISAAQEPLQKGKLGKHPKP